MKKYEDLTRGEQQEVTRLFTTWLEKYSHEVIVKVIEQRDEIINNDFAMNLLKELCTRTESEKVDFKHSIENMLFHFDDFKKYNPHNHPLSHANSYRDVLYDMYIKNC